MRLSEMRLYHVFRGAFSDQHVRVLLNRSIAEKLVSDGAKAISGLNQSFVYIVIADRGLWEISSSNDWDYTIPLGELSSRLIDQLHTLKNKLVRFGYDTELFQIPGEAEPAKAVPPTERDLAPFDLVRHNRRAYLLLSPEMAEALEKHPLDGMRDDYSSTSSGQNTIRLTDGLRLFTWINSAIPILEVISSAMLDSGERDQYILVTAHLKKLGFEPRVKPAAKAKAIDEKPLFTDVLRNDRKEAARKALQPVEFNPPAEPVNYVTSNDLHMTSDRQLRMARVFDNSTSSIKMISELRRIYGWGDEEFVSIGMELQKACIRFMELYDKKNPPPVKKDE